LTYAADFEIFSPRSNRRKAQYLSPNCDTSRRMLGEGDDRWRVHGWGPCTRLGLSVELLLRRYWGADRLRADGTNRTGRHQHQAAVRRWIIAIDLPATPAP
jgi:hypothetical protein